MPRIAWRDDELLSCVAGVVRRGDQIVGGPDIIDARWRDDGTILTFDTASRIAVIEDTHAIATTSRGGPCDLGAFGDDEVLVSGTGYQLAVWRLDGSLRWEAGYELRGAIPGTWTSVAVSDNGKLVAVGYETAAAADFNYRRSEGRGFVVIDTINDRIVDRSWVPTKRAPAPTRFAFDRTGKRVAIAVPEPTGSIGVLRIGKTEVYPRTHTGGATAVALDARGIVAAYAYPPGIGERRLRVDYLEPGVKGAGPVPILDTLWLDGELSDIVALAFDPTGRRIACLAGDGRVDVVPVP